MRRLFLIAMLLASSAARASMTYIPPDPKLVAPAVQQACDAVNGAVFAIQKSSIATVPKVVGLLPYGVAACSTPDLIAAFISKMDSHSVPWLWGINTMLMSDLSDGLGHK
ncbi:MAG TPA: hypothetical protein VLL82_17520 [Mycobacterium sp.]|nr:hypothetical protein [Mycobacterium sp.]